MWSWWLSHIKAIPHKTPPFSLSLEDWLICICYTFLNFIFYFLGNRVRDWNTPTYSWNRDHSSVSFYKYVQESTENKHHARFMGWLPARSRLQYQGHCLYSAFGIFTQGKHSVGLGKEHDASPFSEASHITCLVRVIFLIPRKRSIISSPHPTNIFYDCQGILLEIFSYCICF